jgi:hypothetical protein
LLICAALMVFGILKLSALPLAESKKSMESFA